MGQKKNQINGIVISSTYTFYLQRSIISNSRWHCQHKPPVAMGMCLFREEQHDEKIVKLAELKKKFHSVISKEENLQNEAEFLWANCCTKVDNGALGGDTNYNMFSVEKHAILSVTQKFIDQIDGGDEKSLSAIDQIINVLPDRTTFAVFKAYVADIVVVLDDELTRRYIGIMS